MLSRTPTDEADGSRSNSTENGRDDYPKTSRRDGE
jgi:hypothetical protein